MAIYHLQVKNISKKTRSSVASSAYRSGVKLTDEATNRTYDFSKKSGVLRSNTVIKNDKGEFVKVDRSTLWNTAESAEKRIDGRTAKEIIIAIPHELMTLENGEKVTKKNIKQTEGFNAVLDFIGQIINEYGVAADYAIHAPNKLKNSDQDNKNYHAHIMITTRSAKLDSENNLILSDKTNLELSNTKLKKLGLPNTQDQITSIRERWAETANYYLKKNDIKARITHKSFKDLGWEDKGVKPTVRLNIVESALERSGIRTEKGDYNRKVKLERKIIIIDKKLFNLTNNENAHNTPTPPQPQVQEQAERPPIQPVEPPTAQDRKVIDLFNFKCFAQYFYFKNMQMTASNIKNHIANKLPIFFVAKHEADRLQREHEPNVRTQHQPMHEKHYTSDLQQTIYENLRYHCENKTTHEINQDHPFFKDYTALKMGEFTAKYKLKIDDDSKADIDRRHAQLNELEQPPQPQEQAEKEKPQMTPNITNTGQLKGQNIKFI